MAKKVKKEPLTPEQAAEAKAARIVELREIAKKATEESAQLCEELAGYCDQNGIKSGEQVGCLQAIRKPNPVKLVGDGLTKKEEEYAKEMLVNELPDFVKKSLDLTKMYAALATNAHVRNALETKELALFQETVWMFKAA